MNLPDEAWLNIIHCVGDLNNIGLVNKKLYSISQKVAKSIFEKQFSPSTSLMESIKTHQNNEVNWKILLKECQNNMQHILFPNSKDCFLFFIKPKDTSNMIQYLQQYSKKLGTEFNELLERYEKMNTCFTSKSLSGNLEMKHKVSGTEFKEIKKVPEMMMNKNTIIKAFHSEIVEQCEDSKLRAMSLTTRQEIYLYLTKQLLIIQWNTQQSVSIG